MKNKRGSMEERARPAAPAEQGKTLSLELQEEVSRLWGIREVEGLRTSTAALQR